MWRTASTRNRLGETDIEMQGKESLRGVGIQVWHSEEWPTLCARGTMRTSKRRRMCNAQRLGWLSSSYSSMLTTKLDNAQEVRGIANSKDSVLMQGLVIQLTEAKLGSEDLSTGQEDAEAELLGGHSGVEAGGRKGRGSDDESSGAQLPKSNTSIRKEVDSKEHHSALEADLPIAKEGIQMQGNG
ncbi:hypothetical protein B296_00014165 [Ensete ventricosum]|uniref:Uncharacterized protein n=1 Tax=Ensete ventricosum TaxID=4639 RepID=A0A426YAG2_ENSVE|nr:hypothetical protein B296_00014165 [Ensete ventricosum]